MKTSVGALHRLTDSENYSPMQIRLYTNFNSFSLPPPESCKGPCGVWGLAAAPVLDVLYHALTVD